MHTKRLQRGSVDTLEDYVTFIYDRRFRQLLTHGGKKVWFEDGSTMLVPKVRMTMSKNGFSREYEKHIEDINE